MRHRQSPATILAALLLASFAIAKAGAQAPREPTPPRTSGQPQLPEPTAPDQTIEPGSLGKDRTLKREPLQMKETAFHISVAPRRSNPLLAGLPVCVRGTTTAGRVDVYGAPSSGTACVATGESVPSTPAGALPAMSWEIVTSGGKLPVTVKVSVPRAPGYSALFTVEEAGPAIRRAPSRLETYQRESEPAGEVKHIIRFAGMPYAADTPREILVSVEARDGAGTLKGTDFRLYPYSPRIAAAKTGFATARLWDGLTVDLAGLGLATTLERKNSGAGAMSGDCRWSESDPIENGMVNVSPISLGAHDGTYRLSRTGVISDARATNDAFSCRLLVRLRLRFPLMEDDAKEPILVLASPTPLAFQARQTYHLTHTWALRSRFNLFPGNGLGDADSAVPTLNLGTCSGTSLGPTKYSVGVEESDNDLSFRIRSGPAGTDCRYLDLREQAVRLPNGFELVSSDWKKDDTAKCGLGQNHHEDAFDFSRLGMTVAPSGLETVSGMAQTLYDPEHAGVTLRTDSSIAYRTVLRPIVVWLWCDKTGINDHQIRMTLDEVTFTGPPGADFP